MTPNELLIAGTRAWLEKAREDLQAARSLIQSGLPAPALFHCQQAAEKSFKALLTWKRVAFRKTHDIEEVGLLRVTRCVARRNRHRQSLSLGHAVFRTKGPAEDRVQRRPAIGFCKNPEPSDNIRLR